MQLRSHGHHEVALHRPGAAPGSGCDVAVLVVSTQDAPHRPALWLIARCRADKAATAPHCAPASDLPVDLRLSGPHGVLVVPPEYGYSNPGHEVASTTSSTICDEALSG